MQSRGPLMIEHRLIEQMLFQVQEVIALSASRQAIDPVFVDIAVDFIKMYADRTHHGKEEDILFVELSKKELSEEDRRLMQELVDEHVFGRQVTRELVESNERYRHGDKKALTEIIEGFTTLTEFYPKHIEKEDKVFFPASRTYFSDEEDQTLLDKFREFDRQMIHEKYKAVVQGLKA